MCPQIRNGFTDAWKITRMTVRKGSVTQPGYFSSETVLINDLSTVVLKVEDAQCE